MRFQSQFYETVAFELDFIGELQKHYLHMHAVCCKCVADVLQVCYKCVACVLQVCCRAP